MVIIIKGAFVYIDVNLVTTFVPLVNGLFLSDSGSNLY